MLLSYRILIGPVYVQSHLYDSRVSIPMQYDGVSKSFRTGRLEREQHAFHTARIAPNAAFSLCLCLWMFVPK